MIYLRKTQWSTPARAWMQVSGLQTARLIAQASGSMTKWSAKMQRLSPHNTPTAESPVAHRTSSGFVNAKTAAWMGSRNSPLSHLKWSRTFPFFSGVWPAKRHEKPSTICGVCFVFSNAANSSACVRFSVFSPKIEEATLALLAISILACRASLSLSTRSLLISSRAGKDKKI